MKKKKRAKTLRIPTNKFKDAWSIPICVLALLCHRQTEETRQTILVTEVILHNPETLVLVVIVIEPSLATFPSQLPFIKLHVLGSSGQLELTCLIYGTKALPCCWACATSAFATVYRALCLTDRLRTQKKNVTKKKLRFSAYRRECNIKLCWQAHEREIGE